MKSEELVVTIDVGSRYLKIIIAQISDDDPIELKPIHYYCQILKKKNINNYAKQQIEDALETISQQLKCSMKDAFYLFSIPNNLLNWQLNSIKIPINDGVIKEFHIKRNSKNFLKNNDKHHFVNIDKNYIIDNNLSVPHPVGIKTNHLEIESFVASWKDNKVFEEYEKMAKNFSKNRVTLYPSILTMPFNVTNKENTLCLDLGANKIDYLFWRENLARALGTVQFGISSIINDLSLGLNLPTFLCHNILEKDLKKIYQDDSFYLVKPKNKPERYIPHSSICLIIEMRFEEICQLIKKNIIKSNKKFDYDQILLTGGGANIDKLVELAHKNFNKPVSKSSLLENSELLQNTRQQTELSYTTTMGLLYYYKNLYYEKAQSDNSKNFLGKIRRFLGDN